MKTTRGFWAVATAATLGAVLTGCANGPTGGAAAPAPAVSSAPTADPKAALAAAFAAMNEGSFAYSVDFAEGISADMLVDNDTKSTHAAVTMTAEGESMTIESYGVGDFLYMKMDLSSLLGDIAPQGQLPEGFDGKKWLRLDPSRSDELAGSLDQVALDPAYVERSILTIEQRSAHTFTGTIDLTKLTPARFGSAEESPAEKTAREAAKNVPFRAETDSEGRIVFFSGDLTAEGDTATMKMQFTEWGTAKLPPAPGPGTYVDAPDAFYDMGSVTA